MNKRVKKKLSKRKNIYKYKNYKTILNIVDVIKEAISGFCDNKSFIIRIPNIISPTLIMNVINDIDDLKSYSFTLCDYKTFFTRSIPFISVNMSIDIEVTKNE